MAVSNCHIQSRPHLIMMPYPLQGHITPQMQLAKLLVTRGFAITFVTSEYNVRRILHSKQTQKVSELEKTGIKLVGISDGLPNDHDRHCILQVEDFLQSLSSLHASFDELVRRMMEEDGQHITCIISDSFLLWTQDVANKWRIPRVCFWPNSLTCFACSSNIEPIMAAHPSTDPFKAEVYENVQDDGSACVITCIPGILDIPMSKLPFLTLGGELSEAWMREHVRAQMEHMQNEALCVIANSFPALESDILYCHINKPVFTFGPLLPSAFLGGEVAGTRSEMNAATGSSMCDEDDQCLPWLDKQAPGSVLYISMGSIMLLPEQDIREIALGLEACKQPFLWVLKEAPPCAATVSGETEPALARLVKSGQGKVIRWAPQLRVLSHEAVGGFLTHCGWNSTLESVCMGVPVIGLPQMMDQLTNCWFLVEKLGMGVRLTPGEQKAPPAGGKVERKGVEAAVRKLMQSEEGGSMKMRASRLRRAAQSAHSSALPSALDAFVTTLLNADHRPRLESQT